MDRLKINELKIKHILNNLTRPDGARAEEIFNELLSFRRESEINYIFDCFMNKGDSQSITSLIEYLLKIERPYAFTKLYELTEHNDRFIRQEVLFFIPAVPPRSAYKFILKLLYSGQREHILFALKRLSAMKIKKSISIISKFLETHKNDASIILGIMEIFSVIPLKTSFIKLEGLLSDTRENISNKAVELLSFMIRTFEPPSFKKYLTFRYPQIKEEVYKLLTLKRSKKNEALIVKALREEHDNHLKMKLILWLEEIKTPALLKTLLNFSREDSSHEISMASLSMIKKLKSKTILKYLLKYDFKSSQLEKNSFHKVAIFINILTEYNTSLDILNYLIKHIYHRSNNNAVKLAVINSLARFKNDTAIKFLYAISKKEKQFSYAAASALTHVISDKHWDIVKNFLSESTKKDPPAEKLVFINYIARVKDDRVIPDEIKNLIQDIALSENNSSAVLAVRTLGKLFNDAGTIITLIKKLDSDVSSEYKLSVSRAVKDILKINPVILPDALQKILSYHGAGKARIFLYKTIDELETSKAQFFDIADNFIKLLINEETPFANKNFTKKRIIIFLKKISEKNLSNFMDYMRNDNIPDTARLFLLKILNAGKAHLIRTLSIDFMVKQYVKSSLPLKLEYLKFFKKKYQAGGDIIEEIFNDLAVEKDETALHGIKNLISEWFIPKNRLKGVIV
ncbi:hypothetical protein OMAG_002258 [Candidatus Omnitrophus magneticus]|uniref:HEAT repeat domain-containing protein n=1 Tax=Candidatus Omnitrophus magneticus TaxID=1609969 RepID=A0A0F0CKN4_9BACT|nr:hypothetical protein OMAG_002258 [Candidatus Omnitrophus magneticus]